MECLLLPTNDEILLENARRLANNRYIDSLLFTGCDAYDNKILLFLVRRKKTIQTYVYLRLGYEQIYSSIENHFSNDRLWHSKCIKIECTEPMKTWRISFNGLLKKTGNKEKNDHVKLNFLWHPISSTVYYDKTGQPLLEYRNSVQLTEESLYNLLQGYEQWGTLHGTVQINEQIFELNLNSLKKRSWFLYKKDSITLTTFADNGMLININSVINSSRGHARTLKKHFCIYECDFQYPFKIIPHISFQLTDGRYWYRVRTEVFLETGMNFENLQIFNIVSNIDGVNAINGEGFLMVFRRYKKQELDKECCILPPLSSSDKILLPIQSDESQNSALVGEKAASLSKMNYLLKNCFKKELVDNIHVPNGVCVTMNAMDVCIRQNEDLKRSLNLLKYGLHEVPNSQLKLLCDKIRKLWTFARMDFEIIKCIERSIVNTKSYAIRSSGIHEDNVDFSAAGQSGTYLAIDGITNILNAVKKCWASMYSFESVQYRRDHGLPLYVKLGVIIQQMIITEVHGVLFTCHPITNDPRVISITFSFKKNTTEDDAPSTTILVDKQNFQVIETVYSSEDFDDQSTIPAMCIRTLCKISLELEEMISYSVDVEWGITNEVVYLLQCRPVTTMFTWTNFEISHELDSGFTDFDAITFHNCGEAVVDVTSPLSITFNNRIMEESFQLMSKDPSVLYHQKLLSVSQFRMALNICNGLLLQVGREIPFFQKIIDVIVCGQVITTEALYLLAQKRNGISTSFSSWSKLATSIKLILNKNKLIGKAIKISNEFRINAEEFSSAELLLQHITEQAAVFKEVAECHLNVSSASNILKTVVLSLMCKNDEENLQNHVTNLSWYLSSCEDLVSADVPKSLLEIARVLQKHENKDDYLSVHIQYKCDWMQKNCPDAWFKTKIFFEKHGSRCVKEADLMTETWSMDSDSIFECIDSLIKANKLELPSGLTEYTQQGMASSQRYSRTIKWMLSSCRNAVISREKTKQCLITVLHQFRLAFCRLGKLLTEDSIISNEKSIFYFTFYELHELVKGKERRAILHKGQRRYRLWSHLKGLKFDDVIFGLPHPIKEEPFSQSTLEEIFRLRGTSVSFHSVIGRACILHSIEEVKQIQNGDILITRCIDIGWSPYFPLLSGLITELGGLMSHGAIIARECGLPCVIGVKNVTLRIHTGDKVEINGLSGTITRLQSNS